MKRIIKDKLDSRLDKKFIFFKFWRWHSLSLKGDILCTDDNSILSKFNWECKNQEKLNIWKALEQSRNDCLGSHKEPLVVFTKNFESDYLACELETFVQILLELEQLRNE